jgi:hypothetical protein
MTTWREMARANRTAGHELFAAKRWRSCVSRAYYAIYSEITRCLLKAKVSMPNGQANPKHKTLPTTIETRLTAVNIVTTVSLIWTDAHDLQFARHRRLSSECDT